MDDVPDGFGRMDEAGRVGSPIGPLTADASRQTVVEAPLVLLERMGLLADLTAVPQPSTPVPTFAEYVPVVSAAVSDGTRRAYGSYWKWVIEPRGSRRLDEPTRRDYGR